MALDTEKFQAEIDTVLDKRESEAESAAGVRDGQVSEEGTLTDTDTEIESADESFDSEADREEAEAKKVLGEEVAGEPKDVTTDTDDTTPVQFNDTVLARAVACGITLSEARSFPDNFALGRFVDSVEKNLIHEAAPTKELAKADDETDPFAGLPVLNPDDYSPEVVKTFEIFKDVLIKQQEQVKAYEARADLVQGSMHDAGAKELAGWYDTAVAGLGDDYKDVLGEGAFSMLPENSKGRANRDDIAGKMVIMHDGYVAQGVEPPHRDELFEMAVRMVLPEARSNIQRRELEGELEQQSTQHIQRARGSSNRSTKSPEDATAALLNEKYDFAR